MVKQMMFQQRISEDHASLPPEVEASIIETPALIQEEEQDEGNAAVQLREAEEEMSEAEDDEGAEAPTVFQTTEPSQWVTATTRSGRTSRVPARYREELNVAAIGSAVKNYYHLLCDEEEDDSEESKSEQPVLFNMVWSFHINITSIELLSRVSGEKCKS